MNKISKFLQHIKSFNIFGITNTDAIIFLENNKYSFHCHG